MTDAEIDRILDRGRARVELIAAVTDLLDIWDNEWTSTSMRLRRIMSAVRRLKPLIERAR